MNLSHKINEQFRFEIRIYFHQILHCDHEWPWIAFFVHNSYMANGKFYCRMNYECLKVIFVKPISKQDHFSLRKGLKPSHIKWRNRNNPVCVLKHLCFQSSMELP